MKRIVVVKTDTASSVAQKMLGTLEREVTLVIPKQSKFGASLNNFHLLHREAEKAGKRLTVESVDEEVLAFAKLSGIASSHPFLGRVSGLQDIVPRARSADGDESKDEDEDKKLRRHFRAGKGGAAVLEPEEDLLREKAEEEVHPAPRAAGGRRRVGGPRRVRGVGIVIFVLVLLIGLVWAVGYFFSTATVTVRLETIPWEHQGVFIADAAAAKADSVQKVLPAEIFSLNRNLTQSFPGTGTESVKEYARGTAIIYNSYSSTPQTLVATTRFVGQDGKIFRLADKVVVPGAIVRNGAITPASTTAMLIADKPGAEYNVSSVPKLTIPAFRGSPKFNGFYGVLPSGAKGGYMGTKKVATVKDVEAAKARTSEILKSSLENLFAATVPEGFMVADGGIDITLKKVSANPNTDASGNFNVFGEAVLTAPGFREDDLRRMLVGYAEAERGLTNLTFRSLTFQAKAGSFDAAKKRAAVTVTAKGVLVAAFSSDTFKASLKGLGVREGQGAIGRIQGLGEGKISLWPFWVQTVPSDARRITIIVN